MSTCAELSERMPDVALGRSTWTEAERAHLAACSECRAEWSVVCAGSRLGADLQPVDVGASAARVLLRLRHTQARERARRRVGVWAVAGLAAAAAVVLAVWTGRGQGGSVPPVDSTSRVPVPVATPSPAAAQDTSRPSSSRPSAVATGPSPAGASELPIPELDGLDADALDSLLRVLDVPLANGGASGLPALDDGGDRALERALDGSEG